MTKVLVTGATGFIGKNLVENLSSNGYEVYAMALANEKSNIEHYAIYWTFFTLILVFLCIFPELIEFSSNILGVKVPLHLLLLGISLLLIVKLFNDTIRLSELERKIESIVQEIAIHNKDS